MTNMNKSIIPKSKYGVKYNDPTYFKTKNKQYYNDNIKENPNKSKATQKHNPQHNAHIFIRSFNIFIKSVSFHPTQNLTA